ncbi:CRTAC1 family protein [Streptomyces sp. ST2-7A]|uniref:CRTAC1 family protein n=1 Tax=Streptomyces sp. ST2-7A TaxID=2907214 RepID=UPI001F17A3AC|nr:CRTAC1 family protein [Streptomyces sp. ST2-7A]MCE7079501.1 CRTAC1 family protein [Streptomyces sp. ST2-7A]
MVKATGWLRKNTAGVVAVALMLGSYYVVRIPEPSNEEAAEVAERFSFEAMAIAMPSGYEKKEVRSVNKAYKDIEAWISSVGAGIAMNDLDGDGFANDLCITDPRTDQVVVTPTPNREDEAYEPFFLDPDPLPITHTMAPMGCVPGDFNGNGRMDLLVYYWGRTPILYLTEEDRLTGDGPALTADSFRAVELLPSTSGSRYTGPTWHSNAAVVADFDGDGHPDIFIGNYFPDSPVLDPSRDGGVEMNASMSRARNGGGGKLFLWTEDGYVKSEPALPERLSNGWTLAAAAADLDGDGLPELFLGHDFGTSALLHNRSTPGNPRFVEVTSAEDGTVPKSKKLGHTSFKGMGVDFADMNGDGLFDFLISNITTSFGIQESNHVFVGTAADQAEIRGKFLEGTAPYRDRSTSMGLAWAGWGWDIKAADFDNSGVPEVVQAVGFVKGKTNRWPQLQELAASNDSLISNPLWWPNVKVGDDIAGNQPMRLFARAGDGKYIDIAREVGVGVPTPTRGIATGDSTGDGRLDMAVARQWADPVFYRNTTETSGEFIGLKLHNEAGSPVIGARVRVTLPDGTPRVAQLDGGSGHSGKRSTEIHLGLGRKATGTLPVHITWRDQEGRPREQQLRLSPGWHRIVLGSQAKED